MADSHWRATGDSMRLATQCMPSTREPCEMAATWACATLSFSAATVSAASIFSMRTARWRSSGSTSEWKVKSSMTTWQPRPSRRQLHEALGLRRMLPALLLADLEAQQRADSGARPAAPSRRKSMNDAIQQRAGRQVDGEGWPVPHQAGRGWRPASGTARPRTSRSSLPPLAGSLGAGQQVLRALRWPTCRIGASERSSTS